VWYRSLYWRIAIGFVALLAGLLVAQALLVLWLTGQADSFLPGRSPDRLARLVASDLGAALARDPDLDLEHYVRDQFGRVYQQIVIVMADGRVAVNREVPLPPGILRAARMRLGVGRFGGPGRPGGPMIPPGEAPFPRPPGERPMMRPPGGEGLAGRPGGEGPGSEPAIRGPGYEGARSGEPAIGRGEGAPREGQPRPREGPPRELSELPISESAPIEVAGARVGLVVIPNRGPQIIALLRHLGPTLGLVGLGLLILGVGVASLAIFRPARERMRKLEDAAAALGAGRTSVRAPEEGADEVTALARAFNRMAAALEASDSARRRLLADVSHELRTPLTAIRGYVETLCMADVPLDEETRRRYLSIVGEETQKLEGIVGDLLDLARLEGGGGTIAFQRTQVERLFSRVADRHEHAIRAKGLTFERHVASGASEVWGDPDRLEQALQNLAANAVRHTPNGGRVEFRAEPDGDRVRLVVRDTGPGIPVDHLPRVFDRFYKVDSSRANHENATGSGLGLSIVKAIVERHGGTITAGNAPGGGARFAILLDRPPQGPAAAA
jgi:signal transduction histidine kinase